ncbi:hypothetical protein GCM10010372_83110 [Streptomyces tauricus]|nr:hypothetical protein GCM10010372_83110 [Streptomyces tauricus]
MAPDCCLNQMRPEAAADDLHRDTGPRGRLFGAIVPQPTPCGAAENGATGRTPYSTPQSASWGPQTLRVKSPGAGGRVGGQSS